jgi:hypothetical protein
MNNTITINVEILLKLSNFQKDMTVINKETINSFTNSKFSKLEYIQSAIKPHLEKNNLFISQHVTENGLETILFDNLGNYMTSIFPIGPIDPNNPKKLGEWITYAKRYSLSSILNLIIVDELDNAINNQQAVKTSTNDFANYTINPKKQGKVTPENPTGAFQRHLTEIEYNALLAKKDITKIQKAMITHGTILKNGEMLWIKKDYRIALQTILDMKLENI